MISLYGFSGSRSTRVLWTLEELGLPYEYVQVDLAHGWVGTRPLNELNPACKVPILQHGSFLLTESLAICLYLAEQDPERRLLPVDEPEANAKHLQWCSFVISELEQPLWTYAKHRFALPEEVRVPAVLETARYEFDRVLEILETGLSKKAYILGDQFTVADILIGNTLGWAESAGWQLQSVPLQDYLKRVQQRPALARARQRETAIAA